MDKYLKNPQNIVEFNRYSNLGGKKKEKTDYFLLDAFMTIIYF